MSLPMQTVYGSEMLYMLNDIKLMFRVAGVLFKGSSYTTGSSNGLKKNSNKWLYPLLLLCMLPMLGSMVMLIVGSYDALAAVGKETLIIRTYLTISVVLTLFMGLFYALSILFLSTDNDALLHLPLKTWQICGARFINILIYEYLFEAFVYVPFFVTFGIMSKAGVLFYIYAIVLGALLPVLPVAIVSIIAMLMMRFLPFLKNRDRINVFSTIAVFVFMFAVYIPTMNEFGDIDEGENPALLFEMIAGESSSFTRILGYIVPSMLFTLRTLDTYATFQGLLWFVLSIVTSVLAFAVFMLAAKLMYEKASLGITQTSAKHRKLSEKQLETGSSKSSALKALIMKELRLLLRSPVAFMNCCLMTWIWPIFLLAGFFLSADMETFAEMRNTIGENIGDLLPFVLAGVVAITTFIASTSASTATSISREGSAIVFAKMLPVPYYTQLKAKLYSSFLICGIPGAFVMGVLAFVLNCGLLNSILILLVSGMTFMYVSGIGLLVDMGRPKLVWADENAAIKQNVNSFISFALSIPVIIIVCGLPVLVSVFSNVLGSIAVIAMSLLAVWAVLTVIKVRSDKCYDNIQM